MKCKVTTIVFYTFPQALQWCRLFVNVNFASQLIQTGASLSGIHLGALFPRAVSTFG